MRKTETPLQGGARAVPRAGFAAQTPDARQFCQQPAAVALAYGGEEAVPRVVAKGRGLVAQAIVERARQYGVYVHESREMVALLMQLDLDQRIPPELYRAVAELLAWVYRLEQDGSTPGAAAADAIPAA